MVVASGPAEMPSNYGGGVSVFFVGHRGHNYASSVFDAAVTI